MTTRLHGLLRATAGALTLAILTGCGGGGGGGGGPPAALNISATAPADGVIGVDYNHTIAVTGGTGARNFTISAGALPAGLSLNATTGGVTGTPAGPVATANFTITVTDAGTPQQSDTQALTLDVVNPLVITTGTLPDTSIGTAYNQTITATGGTAPHSFSVSIGELPTGLAISAGGVVSGLVTALATTESFTIRVADSSVPQLIATQFYTVNVALEITTTTLPDALGGEFYSQTLRAQGAAPPYNWSRSAGSMPPGISDPAFATGTVSGTPAAVCAASTSTFTAAVSDSDDFNLQTDSQVLSITVNPVALDITTSLLPSGAVGTPYSGVVQATGGVPPYSFAVTSGALPSQLGPIVAATGQITGTPDTVETRGFDVTVTDACADTAVQSLSITINAASPGRNNTTATATPLPLGNATFSASISPSGNPNTFFAPDEDYYRITTQGPLRVAIDINAQVNGSPLDSVIEFVDANGNVLNTCVAPAFIDPCISDDEVLGVQLDSFLQIQINAGLGATFYLHVVDFRGDARPDLLYDIVMSISN
ncbi:MAG: putative Ig domain-containing protein [Steroidobacteraceae bacterium]